MGWVLGRLGRGAGRRVAPRGGLVAVFRDGGSTERKGPHQNEGGLPMQNNSVGGSAFERIAREKYVSTESLGKL